MAISRAALALLIGASLIGLIGCGSPSEPPAATASADAKLSPQEQIDKLKSDPTLNGMERQQKIAEIQAKMGK